MHAEAVVVVVVVVLAWFDPSVGTLCRQLLWARWEMLKDSLGHKVDIAEVLEELWVVRWVRQNMDVNLRKMERVPRRLGCFAVAIRHGYCCR